jgi:CheY-like chemotaxis protein
MNALQVVAMTTKTILLIYQEPNMQEVIQACLADLGGWNIKVANSTVEGLRQAILALPDSIILDFSLSQIDKLLFLKELRMQPATQEIPVVLLALKPKWSEVQQSYFQPYNNVEVVIMNPFDPALLSVQIARVLGWT